MIRKLVWSFGVLAVIGAGSLLLARIAIARAARGRTSSDVSRLPHRRVGLVLGCPRLTGGGWSNPFFENRIAAAAALYHAGKVDYLLVSGDNHIRGYDEPTDMKQALVGKGVPADRIYLDYAGFRTLDSVVRAKEIFRLDSFTLVSQQFHNERAIFLATHRGIDAIGLNAADISVRYSPRTHLREQFARVTAVLDIYLLRRQPHFLGDKIEIGAVPILDANRPK